MSRMDVGSLSLTQPNLTHLTYLYLMDPIQPKPSNRLSDKLKSVKKFPQINDAACNVNYKIIFK